MARLNTPGQLKRHAQAAEDMGVRAELRNDMGAAADHYRDAEHFYLEAAVGYARWAQVLAWVAIGFAIVSIAVGVIW